MLETEGVNWIDVSPTARGFFEQGVAKGREEGIEKGIEKGREEGVVRMLSRIFVRRLGRSLTEVEQQALGARARTQDPEDVEDRALSLEGEALAAWLLDPNAK